MCYILDSAIDHMNWLEKQPVELKQCMLCEDDVHESMTIRHPMTDEPVCKWCCDNHTLLKDVIQHSEPEDMEDFIDDIVRSYKKKFNP